MGTEVQGGEWLNRLKDATVRQKVLARLARVENGNIGYYKQLAADLFAFEKSCFPPYLN